MDVLSYWRLAHEAPLSIAQKIVENEALKVDKNAFTAKRLKRYISIEKKLKRFKDMKLKNMQDIGGCRAVVSSTKKLSQLIRLLKKRPEFRGRDGKVKCKDYINNPKDDGYRSYHLIGRFKDTSNEEKNIEVQLRTRLQHDWATALEIVDIFTKQNLKSNQGDIKWGRFFRRVSEQIAAMEKASFFDVNAPTSWPAYLKLVLSNEELHASCIDAQKLIKDLGVVDKFNAFAHSIKFADGQLKEKIKERYGFILINIDLSKTEIHLNFFKENEIEEAENNYIECEKSIAGKIDHVAALVSTTAVDGIKEAYPNYFADSTDFLRHLIVISTAPVGIKPPNVIDRITDYIMRRIIVFFGRIGSAEKK